MVDDSGAKHRVTFDALRDVMKLLVTVPRPWWALMLLAALASVLDVTISSSGWSAAVRISSGTVVVLGLFWLPVLINLLALAGGTLKFPSGEATSKGLLDLLAALRDVPPDLKRETFPPVIAALGSVPDPARENVRAVRTELEEQLSALPMDQADARARLRDLVQRYDELRPNRVINPRTVFDLDRLAAEVLGFVRVAHHEPAPASQFREEGDGERIIDLVSIEALPSSVHVPQVLDAIRAPRSAFEQYQALLALDKLVPELNVGQQVEAIEALKVAQSDASDLQITRKDPSRWVLSGQLVSRLTHGGSRP
jgi:hypothetical protein